jgi:hypothetical protein
VTRYLQYRRFIRFKKLVAKLGTAKELFTLMKGIATVRDSYVRYGDCVRVLKSNSYSNCFVCLCVFMFMSGSVVMLQSNCSVCQH